MRDLCAYLALLRTRFDDHALLVVLASPLVGVSNDGLLALRAAAQRALYWPIELGQLDALPERDRALIERFKELYDRLVRASAELGLAALLERIVAEHDYDLACLAAPDGDRRLGNVRKLVRAARGFERDHGPDLAGFVDQMKLCDARDMSEADAPPGVRGDAVTVMTIHASKGLEFPIVCVPDLSRPTPADSAAVAVGRDGAVGLRLRDARGRAPSGPVFERLAADDKAADEDESDRVAYVAWTRARDRLLLGGWLGAKRNVELQRVLAQLGLVASQLEPGVADIDAGGAQVRVHVHPASPSRRRPAPARARVRGASAPGASSASSSAARSRHPVASRSPRRSSRCRRPPRTFRAPSPTARSPSTSGAASPTTRSASSACDPRLRLTRRCAARCSAMRSTVPSRSGSSRPARGSRPRSALPWRRCSQPGAARRSRPAWPPPASSRTSCVRVLRGRRRPARVARHLRARAGRRPARDRPQDDGAGGREPAAVVESEYALQRAIYALAALRSGAPAAEIAFCFLERPEAPVVRRYATLDAEALAAEVQAAIARLRESRFSVRAGDHCATCPALDRLCPAPGWRGREPA